MMHRTLFGAGCLLLLLTACGSYDFAVNDRVVYRPGPLFEDYEIPDKALRKCVERAISNNSVSAAAQLSRLDCSNSGVANLAGLSTFTGIQELWLSYNSIVDLTELGPLSVLQTLYIDHNQVVEVVPLYQLPALFMVDLKGNPDLLCPDSISLFRAETVILPKHCR